MGCCFLSLPLVLGCLGTPEGGLGRGGETHLLPPLSSLSPASHSLAGVGPQQLWSSSLLQVSQKQWQWWVGEEGIGGEGRESTSAHEGQKRGCQAGKGRWGRDFYLFLRPWSPQLLLLWSRRNHCNPKGDVTVPLHTLWICLVIAAWMFAVFAQLLINRWPLQKTIFSNRWSSSVILRKEAKYWMPMKTEQPIKLLQWFLLLRPEACWCGDVEIVALLQTLLYVVTKETKDLGLNG